MTALALTGRCAAITGAGSGIGRALAIEAASRGMTVALADVDAAASQETLRLVRDAGGEGIAEPVDVRDADALCTFADAAWARFGTPAAVFANAGVLHYGSTLRPDLATWRRTIDINLLGAVNTVAAFLARMLAGDAPGQFVLTGSLGSFVPAPELAAYGATKHAVWALAECLRYELAGQDRVGVSLLAPPRVATPLLAESVARSRRTGGDDAADALLASAMTPAAVAVAALDGVAARTFYIAPGIAHVLPVVRARVDELTRSDA